MTSRCRVRPEELVAWLDETLPSGRREIVAAHLAACRHCQERLATFQEVDRIIKDQAITVDVSMQRRADLRARLHEADRRAGKSPRDMLWSLSRPPLIARLLAPVLLLLLLLPVVSQADFPLSHFVRFGEVETTRELPPDQQVAIRHVAPSDPHVPPPSFPVVAPLELPLGLVRVEQSVPAPEQVELLYRNGDDVALLFFQAPADIGMVKLERAGTEIVTIRGTPVLLLNDPRPDAVSALTWERDGVFFNVLVLEAPTGKYGGWKHADALQVVEAMMMAQDAGQE